MKILIIFFITFISFASNANDKQLVIDSSNIEVRKPSESSIEKFKSDKEFIYDEEQSQNWWDAFWIWVGSKLSKLMGSKAFGFVQAYLGYIIILAAVIIVILVLNKSKLRGLFYFNKESKISGFKETKEDINEIDFDNLITEAISKSDYRIAVRLYYLKTLKLLSDRKLIDWKINKTNQNYVKEIKEEELKKPFEKLTYIFDWIWYGEMPVAESVFEETKNNFKDFQSSLQAER
ncbi:MAG: hypothetical protein P8Z35_20040 [Ignavibacteriaceae bacterium]